MKPKQKTEKLPEINKLDEFVKSFNKLFDQQEYQVCKSLIESALREDNFSQLTQLHLLCGKVNLKLKYMIISETMLVRAA